MRTTLIGKQFEDQSNKGVVKAYAVNDGGGVYVQISVDGEFAFEDLDEVTDFAEQIKEMFGA